MFIKMVQKMFLKRFRLGRYLDGSIKKYYRQMILLGHSIETCFFISI